MKKFGGFPAQTKYRALPAAFFSTLLPQIDDLNELKITLHLISTLYQRKGYPRFVSRNELLADPAVRQSLRSEKDLSEALDEALALAVARGGIIQLEVRQKDIDEKLYLPNTVTERDAVSKIKSGGLSLPEFSVKIEDTEEAAVTAGEIYSLYEENIGILTPIIADAIKEAEKNYPLGWLKAAIVEAAASNKHSWRYIARILESWASEGKDSGTLKRHPAPPSDPDKYIRGKYGHMVQR
jgi:DnaD/phage-associated family protein